jgi:putative DNA primase/helicase
MSARTDLSELLASVSLPELISRYVALKKDGREYKGLCPFHAERTPSFTVYAGEDKERFHCHGCGVGGDAIDFIQKYHSVDFRDAVAIMTDKTETIAAFPKKALLKKAQRLTRPAEKADGLPNMDVYAWGEPSSYWAYRSSAGELIFYVARYDVIDGAKKKKITPQWTVGSTDGGRTWSWGMGHYSAPRPLYGLDRLADGAGKPVVLCEGEKATDAAQRLLPGYVAMTWAGGSKAAKFTDFAPLGGRDVVLWPDADALAYPPDHSKAGEIMPVAEQIGTSCMIDIANKITGIARSIRLVQVNADPSQPGWDAADVEEARWTPDFIAQWIEERAASWSNFIATDAVQIAANEDAIALAFADKFSNILRYCHDQNTWLEWDGNRWRPERKSLAFHYAREIARSSNIKAERGTAKASTAGGAERFARADPRIATVSSDWDGDPWLLATPDGTVELKTGELRDSRPGDRITKITAAGVSGECPVWNQFLEDATRQDGALIDYLQRVSGYCLTGSVKEHALFFFHGDGGNGKGTFLNTLTAIMQDYAKVSSMTTFTASKHEQHATEIAFLHGARMVTAQEVEEGKHWATAKIKSLTGGDPITARVMRGDPFTFLPTFKILIAGNNKPALKTVDEAVRRRFHMIPFTNKPSVIDKDLDEKLQAEWPGILNWMIEGCLLWQRIGLAPPPIVTESTQEYFEDQNTFHQWVAECCETGQHYEDTVGRLFGSWAKWCDRNGEYPGTSKSFSQVLSKEGYIPIRSNSARKFRLISVISDQSSFRDQRFPENELL